MTSNIGLNDQQIKGSTKILNQVLADTFVLDVKTRKYHWNVLGIHFYELHKFFQSVYEELDELVDEIAERNRSLMAYTAGSMGEFVKTAVLQEDFSQITDGTQMLQNLLIDFESQITYLRQSINEVTDDFKDAGTADFLTGIIQKHEKTAWMIRSLLD